NISNESIYNVSFNNIRIISSPDISVDGRFIVFSGFDGTQEDIFIYEISTKKLQKLTDDIFYDSEPRISPDNRRVYFVSSRGKDSLFSSDTDIYFIDLDSREIEKLIDLGGEEQNPFVSVDGKYLFFVSTIDGVRNIFFYDFESRQVKRFSKVVTGAFSPKLDFSSTRIIFSSINNFTYNVYDKLIDFSKFNEVLSNNVVVSSLDLSNFNYEWSRIDGVEFKGVDRYVLIPTVDYLSGAFTLSSDLGFILLFGANFSDLLGDQRLSIIFNNSYLGSLGNFSFTELNYLVSYVNYKYYFDFGFQVYNFRDYLFSLVNFFYLPSIFYDIDFGYYSKLSISGFVSYPFSTFSRLDFSVERLDYFGVPKYDSYFEYYSSEKLYSLNSLSLSYSYDSTLWSIVGPVDGIRSQVRFSYSPFLFEGDKSLFSIIGDFRGYVMLSLIDTLAFRFVAGGRFGQDADMFKFVLGGIGTIRGYDFGEFAGKFFLLSNLELRIAIIRALLGPFGFSFPPIFASAFVDAGMIGNDPMKWEIVYFDSRENVFKFKDLKVGIGLGVSILLGTGFKIKFDFAS
ncbi:MAG: hypothetical protein ACK4F9_04765, partial [Brevinematia bacterium]